MSGSDQDRAISRWNSEYEAQYAHQADICNLYTLASVLYWQMYGNKCLSNSGVEYGWLSWLRREYGSPRPRQVLELGSGNGDLLLDLQQADFADEFVGLDLSEVAVEVARTKVEQRGLTNISFKQADLNRIQLAPGAYDLVVSQMCVHHLVSLEWLFEQVAQALVPNGVFAVNEYVGPTRWRFTPMQLLLANSLLWLLPLRLRVRYPNGKLKKGIRRPTTRQMIRLDPSEAVRSEEIVPLFRQFFDVEHCIDYGGSISVLVLDDIIANFRSEDPVSLRWFKRILDVDHWARQSGLLPTINVILAGRPRRA